MAKATYYTSTGEVVVCCVKTARKYGYVTVKADYPLNTKIGAALFGRASASMAFDQRDEYGGLQAAIDAHHANVRDTLNDEGLSHMEETAWAAFDAFVAANRV